MSERRGASPRFWGALLSRQVGDTLRGTGG
jgi:hypothetical protein